MALKICKIQVNPAVITAHNTMLASTNAKYPYVKTEIASMTLAKGLLNFSWNQVFQNICPNKVLIVFVDSEATGTGSLSKNPWNFQNYNLSQITLSIDGIPVNGGPVQVVYDATNGNTTTTVLTNLLETSRKWMNNEGIDISRDDIAGGFAIYAFDTLPDFDDNDYLTLKKQGNLRIDAVFRGALPHTVNCIVLAERQGYFEINQSREVILE